MLTSQPATDGKWGFGFQLFRFGDVRVVGHNGGAWGWISDCWIDPAGDDSSHRLSWAEIVQDEARRAALCEVRES